MRNINNWQIALVVSFGVFLVTVKGQEIKGNILPALIAATFMIIGGFVGAVAGLLQSKGVGLPFPDWLNLYKFGIVLMMSVIFLQYLPKNGFIQGLYILGWGVLFFCFRAFIGIKFGMFEMLRYNQLLLFQTTSQYLFGLAVLKLLFNLKKNGDKNYG